MKPVVLFGSPADSPGACRESADVALLWRSAGIPVTILPAHPIHPENPWPKRLADDGCRIELPSICGKPPDWLRDCIVVAFQCRRAVQCWPHLHKRGCKLVYLPTHTVILPHEDATFKIYPPTAIVCESEFQRNCLAGSNPHRIPAAFNPSFFPYRPFIRNGHDFIVGAIGREDPAKWPPRILNALKAAKKQGVKIRGHFLGWTPTMEQNSGKLPSWIQHHPPGSVPVDAFLQECHAILCCSDYLENWPRVVLEAMSSGVPVVADARGGYFEQIKHGETGYLIGNESVAAECLLTLAEDERLRLSLAEAARDSLACLAPPDAIAEAWSRLFSNLG